MNAQDLLDYHFGLLDDADRELIEQQIASDKQLADRSTRLAQAIFLLLDDGDPFDPPVDLADRTIAFVVERGSRRRRFLDLIPVSVPFRWADVAVAAAIFLAGLATLLPAVHRSRAQMEQAGCAFNLQQLGVGLSRYSTSHGGDYPQPPHNYPAGYYAVQLRDAGVLHDTSVLTCPGHRARLISLPDSSSFQSLMSRSPETCQRIVADEYAYNVGFHRGGQGVEPVSSRLQSVIPVLADQPPLDDFCRVLDGNSPSHGGGGQNVLFSDNHVGWLRSRKLPPFDEDIYLNKERRPGLGLSPEDVSLVPSGFRVERP